ncbi:hemerythrin domain-containing protein [Actinomadura sp. ATCC 31491]|uniref:Hemerythrin domain-containing protein n=1 Tax=Actinomadura luzonensis TaxID=2805427 RepID=A0ABT0FZD7_9ACTN|nr:hemerythrin domain-containing protein [Actinomadura luzonensis]MCK2217634.1 hemerythrin domain-containing protein [Actinomadura luzonensis]
MATDVITLITKDHRTVESLFDRLKKGEGDIKATVAELHALLIAHARAEEDRVYPGLDAHHSVEEHKEAEVLLDALVRAQPGTPEFRTTLQQLIESVQHHVEEEESELLPALRKSAGEKRLQELGRAFKERRDAELKALGVPQQGSAEGATKAELYEAAQKADIPGRSQMDKEELAAALKQAKS